MQEEAGLDEKGRDKTKLVSGEKSDFVNMPRHLYHKIWSRVRLNYLGTPDLDFRLGGEICSRSSVCTVIAMLCPQNMV